MDDTMGERIKKQRQAKGKTQQEIADACGVNLRTVRNWEQDKTDPGYYCIDILCKLLGCDPDYLFLRCDDRTHELTDIKSATGLSEGAIKALQSARNVSLLQKARAGTYLIKMKDDTEIDCINWFIEEGLLPILGSTWANRRERNKCDAEREKMPEIIRDIVDSASKSLEGVTPGGDYDMLLRSAILKELHQLSDAKLKTLCNDDYFQDLDNYKKSEYEFSEIVSLHTLPKKNCPDYQEYAFPMAYLIADKEHDYMMYVRERDLKTQVVINRFARLIDEYMNKDPG